MKKIVAIIFILICCKILLADQTIRLVKINLPDHSEVYKLNKFDITVIDAGKNFAKVLVNDEEIADIKAAGYQIEILIQDYKKYKDEIFQRGFYHTYAQVYAVLDSFATDYSDICRLDTIGYSVQNRAIWAMRVTDNPQMEESEPEIRLPANMHGDEHIGTEITLYFLRHLLTNYATNSQVQALIDNREIWILPTINPDGKVANTRRNANNVDLNRDYGYFWDGWGGSPGPSSQVENKIMMQHLEENNISLEYNYHSAAQYVNYPWDYHYVDPPDSQHIINLSEIYADSAALTAINGYDWYQVTGSLQDYTFGISGGLAWTIETLEPAVSSQIDQICYNNRDALMDVCERAGWGIEGTVKDSVTSTPLYARIEFMNPDRVDIYTDPNLGDFHKMIEQGTYDLRVSANGYAPKVINNVNVSDTGSTSVGDVLLVPDSSFLYAFRPVLCRYVNHAEQANATRPRAALGNADSLFFSLGQGGYVVLDMGSDSPIGNTAGDEITVYEGNDGVAEGYEVFVSNSWDGSWYSCGSDTGTASFDLSTAGLTQARYVKIVDDGSASSGTYAGFDLDAIRGSPRPNVPCLSVNNYQILDGNNGVMDPGETADFVITLLNTGILEATNTHGTLRTDDVYVTISDSSGFYGDIPSDSEKTNTSDPFTISASDTTPFGHKVNFDLIVTADDYIDTLGVDIVVGKKDYYLWNPDPTATPGQNMDSILTDLGYNGDYGTSLAEDLSLYQSVFVCVGIFSNNYLIASGSPGAAALVDFLENQGGRMYLEGGDVWFYDPLYNGSYDFGPLFGIDGISDGFGDLGPVVGEGGAFTNGMDFTYGGENNYIDHIDSTGTGFLIFHDEDNAYNCGVANDPGTYRTVGTSFELGLLDDGASPSTRAVLLDSIMQFFGIIISEDTIAPLPPNITQAEKSGNNMRLTWNTITTDTMGNPETMDCYIVYCSTSPSFVPGASDSIGAVAHPETTYVDSGALIAAESYYYLVKAVDSAQNRSKKSNMGYVLDRFFNYNTDRSSRNWVSLSWHSGYSTVSDLVADLSPAGDPLESVTNLRDDMVEETWLYDTDFMMWSGPNDFTIDPGRGYEMVAIKDTNLVLVGSNDPDGLISLNYNADRSSRNWVSIPYNADYSTVDDIAQEYSPAGDPLESISNLRDDMVVETWLWDTDFMMWFGPNDFAIVPGRGYEFVPIKDTTWNPNEYSNEAFVQILAARSVKRSDVEVYGGQFLEPDRAPKWIVKESEKKIDYSDAKNYKLVTKRIDEKADYREPGISHIVRVHLNVKKFDNLVFTAYRPEQPYDVLTENMIGSCVAIKDDQAAFFFNVANFKRPWQDKEEVIIIIEATKQDKGYFTVVNITLDERVDIQDVDNITLVPIPEPAIAKGLIVWNRVNIDNIVGYSLYKEDKRLNDKVLKQRNYTAAGDVNLRPVIRGGYETTYGSQGLQSTPDIPTPIKYAFNVFPNPFVAQTRINYAVPRHTSIEMVIFDVSGRQVKILASGKHKPGYYSTVWYGADDTGRKVSSGVYFIRFEAGGFSTQDKILLVK